ncbi:MAG TPA: PTS sugar transporter subunit IIC [Clostridium sp.]
MTINLVQAILIGIVYYLAINGTPWLTGLGSAELRQPVVAGTLVGLILGDPVQGCIIGAAINLPFIGFISAGGTMSTDPALAGIVGTALAMLSGASPQVAVTLAIPIGILGTLVWVAHMTVDIGFVHMMDKAAEEGNLDKMNFLNVVPPQLITLFMTAIPVALIVYFGSGTVKTILTALSGRPLAIITVIGGILPALGIAMNLRTLMNRKGVILFYLLGFLMVTYFKLPILVVAIFAFIIAYFYTELSLKKEGGVS